MKKNILVICVIVLLLVVISIFVFRYYHPTHFAFNDRFIIGSTQEQIVKKYGEFTFVTTYVSVNDNELITKGVYMIRDNTPELIMSYDNSLWYEVYFKNGIAFKVRLREGYIGG